MRAPRSESRKHLTQDFRVEAVRLAETRERSRRRHVAEDLGVGLSTLRRKAMSSSRSGAMAGRATGVLSSGGAERCDILHS